MFLSGKHYSQDRCNPTFLLMARSIAAQARPSLCVSTKSKGMAKVLLRLLEPELTTCRLRDLPCG